MSSAAKVFYWDTSMFLCFLNGTEKDRRAICEDILRHAQQGEVTIVTSTFAIVETIRPKWIKAPVPLTPEQVRLIHGMFQWPWIKKYQLDERLALAAVGLARDFGLKPGDAIHAATAIQAKVDVLQHWDRDFTKIAHLVTTAHPALLTPPLPPLLQQALQVDIGPSQEELEAAGKATQASAPPSSVGSTASAPPSGLSVFVDPESKPDSAPVPPSVPQAAQAPPRQGSSPPAAPPPQSEQ